MNTRQQKTTGHNPADAAVAAMSSVMSVGVRVAGRVPTRVDLRFAGTADQQLGLSLGTVLVYLRSHLTARAVALAWGEAAAQARSLSPMLPDRRRPAMVSGPWSVAAMVRMSGIPATNATLLPAQRGHEVPTMLRMQVGPVTWELADAAAYTSLLNAWRTAADLLAVHAREDT
ncbi:MAG: hypothetical protein M3235_03380 [Actinomycetota bacterium]|nr:hypothetical protein [Actinomycetota bacterium]